MRIGRSALYSLLVLLLSVMPVRAIGLPLYEKDELTTGYIMVTDEAGTVVLETGHAVQPGDQFISDTNRLYEITSIDNTSAKARFIRWETDIAMEAAVPAQAQSQAETPLIAVYHTHTDESYIPSEGKSTDTGKGSIMLVGDVFAQRLADAGYRVVHDTTLHDPHDANAYQRSRRTFFKLLDKQPAAFFDIHRDSAPLSAYKTTINGIPAAKILLVVGKQNQNLSSTLSYAKQIKAAADRRYSGLIRGIFIAHGNYNQDLNPRAMLVEMGTQFNDRSEAEHSAVLFADVVPAFLKIHPKNAAATPAPQPADQQSAPDTATAPEPSAPAKDIYFLIGAVVVGTIAFLYISSGSLPAAGRKLRDFLKYEFNDLRSRRKKD